ncbi:TPA: PilZ domain-containing protein [Stenotrophomonas maltophilia]|uniref:PilZ domain-containing protein n=1 Tax=Stenotrophomonas TaxID=40323 RepID=UPI0028AFFCFA|nr:PilZ domain-containing protein [Stenotrophomonas sp.]HDS0950768.1 PilZ domain-containing protein [Stenotrophomonas maltophilia]HDS1026960.1 PilZ domain-containing protein [Stenotrophomonas maltophilia]HDS1030936.1 PilZ domain-containing protein [Stenotrophomonas maltophilia]HDS1035843.1 PilZ domain-containing protein [Stenotrophomonas maltophilia]HDS1040682.1 PilZ domain-containing protein [Stenotrophomonas maltophilia]
MNQPTPQDTRRAPRRQVADLVPVTDQMRECVVGRLGNVSETGMLMLSSTALRDDALYQFRFPLAMADGRSEAIDVGVHLLWSEPAHAPGQSWAGFRFLTLSREHRQLLRHWIGEDSDETPVSTG